MCSVFLCGTTQELFVCPLQAIEGSAFQGLGDGFGDGFVLLAYTSRGKPPGRLDFALSKVFKVFLDFACFFADSRGDRFEFTETFWTSANQTRFGFMWLYLLSFLASDYVTCVYVYDKERCCACTGLGEMVGSPSLEILTTGLAKALSNGDLICGGWLARDLPT